MRGSAAGGAIARTGATPGEVDFRSLYPLYGVLFIVEMGLGIVTPILPDIKGEFFLSAWQVGLVVTVFATARLAADLPLGLLLDRLNRTLLLATGTVLIMVGSVGSALAGSFPLLLVARLVMGAGTAICLVTALFTVSRGARENSRGRSIALYQASCLAGITFSPAVGGVVASFAGWRGAFLFCAFAGAFGLLMVLVASRSGALRLPPVPRVEPDPRAGGSHPGGRRRIPWNLVAINFTSFALFVSMSGFRGSVAPVYGGTVLGIGAAALGLMLGGSALIRSVMTLASGFASDRYGRKIILLPGVFALTLGSLSFLLARDHFGFGLCLMLLSLGGFGNSLPTIMLVDAVHGGRVGLAISVNRFMSDAGMLVGPVALGWVYDVAGFPASIAATAALLLSTVPGIALTVRERPGTARRAALRTRPG